MRLKSHNEFGKDWTSKYRPWKLLYKKEFETKHDALKYEKWLKTGSGVILLRHGFIKRWIHIRGGGHGFNSHLRYKAEGL
jgi:hypothetical protein